MYWQVDVLILYPPHHRKGKSSLPHGGCPISVLLWGAECVLSEAGRFQWENEEQETSYCQLLCSQTHKSGKTLFLSPGRGMGRCVCVGGGGWETDVQRKAGCYPNERTLFWGGKIQNGGMLVNVLHKNSCFKERKTAYAQNARLRYSSWKAVGRRVNWIVSLGSTAPESLGLRLTI